MNLYLIGYRGSGKSTIAPLIAEKLNWRTVDTDDLIESTADSSIAKIFEDQGESGFRELETKVITRLSRRKNQVISLGGGAPMSLENRELIGKTGGVIWLKASTDVLWERISGDKTTQQRRPDLTDQGGRGEVEELLRKRNPVYEACADYTIDVDDLTAQEVADRIVEWWNSDDKKRGA